MCVAAAPLLQSGSEVDRNLCPKLCAAQVVLHAILGVAPGRAWAIPLYNAPMCGRMHWREGDPGAAKQNAYLLNTPFCAMAAPHLEAQHQAVILSKLLFGAV